MKKEYKRLNCNTLSADKPRGFVHTWAGFPSVSVNHFHNLLQFYSASGRGWTLSQLSTDRVNPWQGIHHRLTQKQSCMLPLTAAVNLGLIYCRIQLSICIDLIPCRVKDLGHSTNADRTASSHPKNQQRATPQRWHKSSTAWQKTCVDLCITTRFSGFWMFLAEVFQSLSNLVNKPQFLRRCPNSASRTE